MNKWVSTIIIALLVLNLTTMGIFWFKHFRSQPDMDAPNYGNEGPPPQPLHEFVANELKLNEEQKKAYLLLRDDHRQFTHALQDSLRLEKRTFFEKIADSTINKQKIDESYLQIANLQKNIDINTFYHFKKLREICQEEQKIKLDSLISKILSMMRNGRNRPRPPF
jgi:Spy/CpxP family protein refolding chaperone